MNSPFTRSNLFELWTFGGIFHDPAFGFQLVTNLVAAFEVFRLACGLAGFEQGDNFSGRFRSSNGFDAEDGIDLIPGNQQGGSISRSQSLSRNAFIGVADPIEDRGPSGGDVEVGIQCGGEVGDKLGAAA